MSSIPPILLDLPNHKTIDTAPSLPACSVVIIATKSFLQRRIIKNSFDSLHQYSTPTVLRTSSCTNKPDPLTVKRHFLQHFTVSPSICPQELELVTISPEAEQLSKDRDKRVLRRVNHQLIMLRERGGGAGEYRMYLWSEVEVMVLLNNLSVAVDSSAVISTRAWSLPRR